MNVVFSLCLPRDEASVPVVRHMCRAALQRLGIEDGCEHDIEVAVTEACSNVLKHAAAGDEQYEVKIEINDVNCEIRVFDSGGRFDHATERGEPRATDESGRGIRLMGALVDSVSFVSQPESGTIVHLVKRLELKGDSILKRLAAPGMRRAASPA